MPAARAAAVWTVIMLVAGCGTRPSGPDTPATTGAANPPGATRPTQPEPPADPDAWKAVAVGPITAVIESVEVRPAKTVEAFTRAEKTGPESLVIRVRFANSDDTFNAAGAVFTDSGATDDFGNTTRTPKDPPFQKFNEPDEYTDLTPNSPCLRSFVFEKPVPKATRVRITIVGHFAKARARRIEFPFTVPLPPAK